MLVYFIWTLSLTFALCGGEIVPKPVPSEITREDSLIVFSPNVSSASVIALGPSGSLAITRRQNGSPATLIYQTGVNSEWNEIQNIPQASGSSTTYGGGMEISRDGEWMAIYDDQDSTVRPDRGPGSNATSEEVVDWVSSFTVALGMDCSNYSHFFANVTGADLYSMSSKEVTDLMGMQNYSALLHNPQPWECLPYRLQNSLGRPLIMGVVHIFRNQGSLWSYHSKLSPPDFTDWYPSNQFGDALSFSMMSGEIRLAIGCAKCLGRGGPSSLKKHAGSVFIFSYSETQNSWSLESRIDGEGFVSELQFFGTNVAFSQDCILARAETPNQVFFYREDPRGIWNKDKVLKNFPSKDGVGSDSFFCYGCSLGLSEDSQHAYIGSTGAVGIFYRNSDYWDLVEILAVRHPKLYEWGTGNWLFTDSTYFGFGLFPFGRKLVITAYRTENSNGTFCGRAYLAVQNSPCNWEIHSVFEPSTIDQCGEVYGMQWFGFKASQNGEWAAFSSYQGDYFLYSLPNETSLQPFDSADTHCIPKREPVGSVAPTMSFWFSPLILIILISL